MIKFGENNLPPEKIEHLKQRIQMVEKRTNIKVEDYVNFGDKGSVQYKLYTAYDLGDKYFYIGEMN